MNLHFSIKGEGEPVILLHGLFGSLDNLGMIARGLESDFRVLSFDLRNHGRSPHANHMSYDLIAADVVGMMDELDIGSAHFYGHSMGGKTAMQIALNYPRRVKSLIVGDIAPVTYAHHHKKILEGMREVERQMPQTRSQARHILADYIDEPNVLGFILTNFKRDEAGSHAWRLGLDAIEFDHDTIMQAVTGTPFNGKVLFIKGGTSDYILSEHREKILELFPAATVRIIEGTGHWFHADKPDMTIRIVKRFLGE